MAFTYDVELTNDDGTTEKVTFTLKPASQVPVGILRRNRHNEEAQMWATLEWGLTEDQLDAFDRLTAGQVGAMLGAWQAVTEDEVEGDQDKPVSPPKSKKASTTPEPDPEE